MERIKKFEKGGHCETMKKDVGGRTGREGGGKCELAKRKRYRKIALKWNRKGKDRRAGRQGSEINATKPQNCSPLSFRFSASKFRRELREMLIADLYATDTC